MKFKYIKQYIEGNLNLIKDKLVGQPIWYQEQILYRFSKCQDCYAKEIPKCKECGCKLPGKHYVTESCNPDRFPDLMNEHKWNQFKEKNDIQINLNESSEHK